MYYYDRETKSVLGGFNYLELAPGRSADYMVEAQEAQMQDDGGWRLLNGRELRFDEGRVE
ncbi:MAG: hypothetical protein HC888_15315 [Candidatus Competibacteraceae bacterium]|nr:hypothetical protein [Candidatus Competibacteraceae bacterium]